MDIEDFFLTNEELDILRKSGYSDDDIEKFIKMKNDKKKTDSCSCNDRCKYKYDYNKLPDISKFNYFPLENNFYDIKYNNKPILFSTPILCLPFGIDKYYKDWRDMKSLKV